MNLNHLKAFVKVVQMKSYQDAAKVLHVSQPAITLRIQTLEEHFHTKLMQRKPEGLALTQKGEQVYYQVLEILKMWDKLESQLLSNEPSGKLSLGASTIPSEYLVPGYLKKFRETYPEVNFNMKVAGTKEVIKWLRESTVDIVVTGRPEENSQITSIPIFNDTLKVIVPPHMCEGVQTFSDLLAFDWILRDQHSNTRQAFEHSLQENGYHIDQLRVACQMNSTEAVIAAVEAGLGVSVVSELAAMRAAKFERVNVLRLPDFNSARSFYISYLNESENQPIIIAFLSFVTKCSLPEQLYKC